MFIQKIRIKNYRGIKDEQIINLSSFSSIIGKNDSGKSIVLNAIATFLDPKSYPIVESDFNDLTKPIVIECHFDDDDLKGLLEKKVKSKIKKNDGLDEFLKNILFSDILIYQKTINKVGKSIQEEKFLIEDFDDNDFSFIYVRSDEELNTILERYKIEIPVKGKGRNSKLEKIKFIQDYCLNNNIPKTIRTIEDEYKISAILPSVELFVSDYGLKADTSFRTNSVSEIKNYFDEETKDETKRLIQIEKEIQKEMDNEAEAIKGYMLDYTSSLQKVEIEPNIVWKDAIKSVNVNFQFIGDNKPLPMTHKGTGYRRLFMVARFRYLAEKDKGSNVIFLIEEPEAFLHPSAQEDLLNSFKDLAVDNQIVLTTHSPVFAGATSFNSVVLCKKDEQSVYINAPEGDKKDFIMDIVDELGIKPSYNLRDHHEKIVFVESKNDAHFFNEICKKVLDRELLNNRKILVLPFVGGEDIESFLNIDYFDDSGRELYLIIDSDKHNGNQDKQSERVSNFNNKERGKAYKLNKSCIENYYHPRAFERVYNLDENTFNFFEEDENVRYSIKQIVIDNSLNNIKEKNNLKVFNETSKEEWESIIETELLDFLEEITND